MGPVIEEMRVSTPEMMSRKIPEANVQQAWVLEKVRQTKAESIFCVGCYEDTTFSTLERSNVWVTGIDPAIDFFDLAGYREAFPAKRFQCVFATSVLEHVKGDEQFIRDLCDLLTKDGVAILTVDYKAGYKTGDPLPATNERFYTPADVEWIGRILEEKGCYWIDVPDLAGEPDFSYQGHHYSFLALVFKKL
jgi:SAM-dependent methyltransferase